MRRVLILGGGFGGLAAAHVLRQRLPAEDEVVLVDRREHFVMGFRKIWALVGVEPLAAGQRPLAGLAGKGIRLVRGDIESIDAAGRAATVDGRRLEADALIVALGAELAPEAVPGFSQHALNFYDPAEIPHAAEAVRKFDGGRLLVGVFGVPYKCPPAPYEAALLLRENLRSRKVQAAIEVFTPLPVSMPLLGQAGSQTIEGRLAENDIAFLPNRKAERVEAGAVVFASGQLPFDLLLGVPPHRCPKVVRESGLAAEGGWVPIDPLTTETRFPNVYAVGDLTQVAMADGKPLPKAGVFAESMGQTAAERIAAVFAGRPPEAVFGAQGGCYLEVGGGQAMLIQGRFLAQPAPEVVLNDAAPELLIRKRAWEQEKLLAWL